MTHHRPAVRRARFRQAPVALAAIVLSLSASPVAAVSLPGAPACPVFPATNVWNKRVDALPVRRDSATLIRSIGLDRGLHPDWGSYSGYGIPYDIVSSTTPRSTVTFQWPRESDAGPYPIPASPRIEGGSDRHILLVDRDACRLYELYAAQRSATTGRWSAASGAIWDLRSNALRPAGWTSADAAGLPILPGLARYGEVAAGSILHALRFTAPRTRTRYIYPARHEAGESDDAALPRMGVRVRLRADFPLAGFGPQARVVLVALKRYGMILADNGSPWYITGAPNSRWDDDDLHDLGLVTGADLEVVDTSTFRNG